MLMQQACSCSVCQALSRRSTPCCCEEGSILQTGSRPCHRPGGSRWSLHPGHSAALALPGPQPQLVCWGEGRAACRLRRDDSLKDIPECPLSSVSVCLVISRKYMCSFLTVTPTPRLGMCLCKEGGFESQGHSSRVCAGGGQKRPGRRAVALSQLLLVFSVSALRCIRMKPSLKSCQ